MIPTIDELKKAWTFFEAETFPSDGFLSKTAAYAIRREIELQHRLPEALIRGIRDNFGDDKCWKDWEALFKMLPEGYTPPSQDIAVELEHCKKYLQCQSDGTEYIPPPRWVVGLPDKPGIWIVTTEDNYRFTISYRGGNLNIKDVKIRCSFGPVPKEPECLSKKDSDS